MLHKMKYMRKTLPKCILCFFIFPLFLYAHRHTAACLIPVEYAADAGCPPPDPFLTGQGSGFLSFAWSPLSEGASCQIQCFNKSTNTFSATLSTESNSITITGLAPGIYKVYFATVCNGEISEFVVTDDLIIL
jgi:hypothetical protein